MNPSALSFFVAEADKTIILILEIRIMKKKLIWLGGILLLVILVAFVFGFVFLGSIVKAGVEQVGPIVTKVPVKLEAATLSVFNGSGELKGFELGNPEGFKTQNAIKVGTIAVSVAPGSVFGSKVVIHQIRVEAPEITFETALKENNLSKILANVQSMAGTNQSNASPGGKGKKLQVDDFVIAGGKINLSATMLGGKSATLPLPEIHLSGMGQGPEGITPVELTEKALNAVVNGTLKAVAEGGVAIGKEAIGSATKLGGEGADAAKNAGTEGAKALEKVGSGIGDMFKKKK
jgi:uncharacterized protein involved in outer membrane biogenesis